MAELADRIASPLILDEVTHKALKMALQVHKVPDEIAVL
jgi:hypothetical protein